MPPFSKSLRPAGPSPARRQIEHDLIHVAPSPILARLIRAHDGMLRRMKMLGGVAILGRITATHVPAFQAQPQMHPGVSHFQAFLAAIGFRLHIPYFLHVRALHVRPSLGVAAATGIVTLKPRRNAENVAPACQWNAG